MQKSIIRVAGAVFFFGLIGGVSAAPAPAKPVKLPETPVGRCAAAWFESFNTGDTAMRQFELGFRAKSALKTRPVDDRIAQYRQLHDRFGDLRPIKVLPGSELKLTVIAEADGGAETYQLDFELEEPAPHGLVGIMIRHGSADATDNNAPLDAKSRAEAVSEIAAAIERIYVFPDKAAAMAELLRKNSSDGKYDSITDAGELAGRLMSDLRTVTSDPHLNIVPQAGAPEAGGAFDPHRAARDNYGFERVERLPGNVGYVRLNLFHPGEDAQETASAAMNFVANCDAVIFDLRTNGGGDPGMIAFLSGYLFDKKVHLNSFYNRVEDKTSDIYSAEEVPGRKLGEDVPVFVLTSRGTFSGAEEFAYNLKNLKRGTIIGARTGGGAHPVSPRPAGDHFTVMVPFARAINPITKTNWEGVGVQPDIEVAAADALMVAQREAIKRLTSDTKDPVRLAELRAAQRTLDRQSAVDGTVQKKG